MSVINLLYMPLSLDGVGERIMFFGLSVRCIRLFVRTELVTGISHERLEQSR